MLGFACYNSSRPWPSFPDRRCCSKAQWSMRNRVIGTEDRQPTRKVSKNRLQPVKLNEMPGEQAVLETTNADNARKTHLVVMVNGLFGRPSNWKYVVSQLEATIDMQHTVLLVSAANSGFQTYRGIDRCGDALVAEINTTAPEYPGLQQISFIGHSLGGLLCRYAAGKLYDVGAGTIAGLRPAHFVTLATPHLGCNGWGPNQVPFFHFLSLGPLKIGNFDRLVQRIFRWFGVLFLGRTGKQLFVLDKRHSRDPLVLRLTQDIDGDASFMSALCSFQTHTCYANTAIDKVVNWPNASLRDPSELPDVWETPFGIVREDPLEAAFSRPRTKPHIASPEHQHLNGQPGSASHISPDSHMVQSPSQPAALFSSAAENAETQQACMPAEAERQQQQQQQSLQTVTEQQTGGAQHLQANADLSARQGKHGKTSGRLRKRWEKEMLRTSDADRQQWAAGLSRLQALPWRRIDVSFRGSSWSTFAHTHIQVTRPFLDSDGMPVVQHLARSLAAMERQCLRDAAPDT
ncbi:hypothetical protein WJX74_006695 [Apatococcus lobatus]|uniref:DUF676 domain-containing protein n=1 Tax=Apatococcus lobatus TaxID=904363 RepID=A0AAW1R297_9CHLO